MKQHPVIKGGSLRMFPNRTSFDAGMNRLVRLMKASNESNDHFCAIILLEPRGFRGSSENRIRCIKEMKNETDAYLFARNYARVMLKAANRYNRMVERKKAAEARERAAEERTANMRNENWGVF